jgi:hypothetical protein
MTSSSTREGRKIVHVVEVRARTLNAKRISFRGEEAPMGEGNLTVKVVDPREDCPMSSV